MTPYDAYLEKVAAKPPNPFGPGFQWANAGSAGARASGAAGAHASGAAAPAAAAAKTSWDQHLANWACVADHLVNVAGRRPVKRGPKWGLGHTAILGTAAVGSAAALGLGNAIGSQSAYGGF